MYVMVRMSHGASEEEEVERSPQLEGVASARELFTVANQSAVREPHRGHVVTFQSVQVFRGGSLRNRTPSSTRRVTTRTTSPRTGGAGRMNISSCLVSAVRRGCLQTFRRPQLLLPVSSSTVQSCSQSSQSSQSVPAARIPYRVKVNAGKRYSWCACGHSKKQPFCDGAHRTKAPSISPLRFTPEKDRTVMLCACKETKNAPYCDGSHFRVIFQDIVRSVKGVFK